MHGTQCGLYRGMMSSFKVEKMQLITSGGGNTPLLRYQSTSAYGNESHNGTRLSLAKSKFLPHRGLLSSSALVSPLLSFSLNYSFLLLLGSFWTLHMSLDLWLWLILINCCLGATTLPPSCPLSAIQKSKLFYEKIPLEWNHFIIYFPTFCIEESFQVKTCTSIVTLLYLCVTGLID